MTDERDPTAADADPTGADADRTPAPGRPPSGDPSTEATYDEFELAGRTVGTVSEPDNAAAWLQSDVTVAVRP